MLSLILFFRVTAVYGKTLYVPSQYPTIQLAIDVAEPGDAVQVEPGTYYENISLKDGVTVQGAGANVTIIDGQEKTFGCL